MEKSGRPEKKRLFGLSLLLSMLVLILEGMLALVVAVVYGITQESPNAGGGSAMFILFLPVVAVFGIMVAGAASVALVFPAAWLGDVLGRRLGGREAWWWVPPTAAAVSLVPVGSVVAAYGGADPATAAAGWFFTTAAITVPALLWRSRRERIFKPVTLWGVAAVVLTAVLGGVGLATGVLKEYRPPALISADIVGRWSDGQGGTVTFTADGRVTAVDVDDDLDGWGHEDDATDPDGPQDGDTRCSGQGTWTYEPGGGTWSQQVDLALDSCDFDVWNVGGTASRPTLYQYIGDPDSGDLYVLRRTDADAGS
ncbi:hypothetical protein LEL86_32940 [Streptomyces sp. WA6-1-16]|uniref:hypothetical protein n=1 Tax=Streptomyces sp. WA6-1-16 TaxID=2879427 RepID=UPI001CE2A312|nr:hypothetical protein [Streptomyces sp. WA6-1-16]UCA53795.1 hypothetical protein LEL86_32940 [Streptomyces sp. WA6-1-16]